MPARTGKVTYVPGKGSYTRGKSGKAKSYSGKGPAPSGSVKTPEATAATAPTVTVSTTGKVATSGFGSKKAARQAQRSQERRQKRRTTAILNTHLAKPPTRPYDPNPITAVISSKPRETPTHGTLADGNWKFTKAQLHPHGEEGQITGKVKGGEWAEAPGKPSLQFDDKTALTSEINRTRAQVGKKPVVSPHMRSERRRARVRLTQAKKAAARSAPPLGALHRRYPELSKKRIRALGEAQRRTGTPAPLLAAISGVESDYGRSTLPGVHSGQNFAGAAGAFQIGNGTGEAGNAWAQVAEELWGPKADQHSIYNFRDAALGAGRYLQVFPEKPASKNPATWYGAALSYNHADWYAREVAEKAAERAGLFKAGKGGNPKKLRNLRAAERTAGELGVKLPQNSKVGPAPKKLVSRVVIAEHAMREIEGQPYVWGGGHSSFTDWGKDCSGAVGYVLNKVEPNKMTTPLSSGLMGQVLEPGPGALTVFYNDTHTFLRLINKKGEAEYWGTSVGDSGGGGLTRHPAPSASYLAQYSVGHVPGMGKKQALQLGAPLAAIEGGGSFAGMSFSSSGTTATISGPATTISGEPGFSKKPIRLTPRQIANRTERKLKSLNVSVSPKDSSSSNGSPGAVSIAELERKYGHAAV